MNQQQINQWIQDLQSQNSYTRLNAFWELVHIDTVQVITDVADFLIRRDFDGLGDWVYSVIEKNTLWQTATILEALSCAKHPDMRHMIVYILGTRHLDIEGEYALLYFLKYDPDETVRARAADLLGKTPQAAETLIRIALRDTVWKVRKAAIFSLGQLRASCAVMPLLDLLLHDPTIESIQAPHLITQVLAKIGDAQAQVALHSLLDHPAPLMRHCAVMALGQLRDTRAVPLLINELQCVSDFEQYQIIHLLRNLATPEALTAVAEYEQAKATP